MEETCGDVQLLLNKLNSCTHEETCNRTACCSVLKGLINLTKSESHRQSVRHHCNTFTNIVYSGVRIIKEKQLNNNDWEFIACICQFLRNVLVYSENDKDLFSYCELLGAGFDLLLPMTLNRINAPTEETAALRSCLQFIGNIVVQSSPSKQFVWTLFSEKNLFPKLLADEDHKVIEYTMMILFNSLVTKSLNPCYELELLKALTDALLIDLVDWGILALEASVCHENFFSCYKELPTKNRFVVLDLLAEKLESTGVENSFVVPEAVFMGLKENFIQDVMDIVKICDSESGDLKSIEITKLLSVLCCSSVSNRLLLEPSKELLEVTIDCLKTIHLLGKQNTNIFSSIPVDLKTTTDDYNDHPIFCFKKNLVRLIGNLCFECKENQDLVRLFDGIPLIMDCCKLDKRNPYMIQWCVLAIRNILESNSENQAVLAGISVADGMEKSLLFQELGLTVEMVNGKPVLKKSGKT